MCWFSKCLKESEGLLFCFRKSFNESQGLLVFCFEEVLESLRSFYCFDFAFERISGVSSVSILKIALRKSQGLLVLSFPRSFKKCQRLLLFWFYIWKNLRGSYYCDFENVCKNLRGSLCFVFEKVWKNLRDPWCFVFEKVLKSLRGFYCFYIWKNLRGY